MAMGIYKQFSFNLLNVTSKVFYWIERAELAVTGRMGLCGFSGLDSQITSFPWPGVCSMDAGPRARIVLPRRTTS